VKISSGVNPLSRKIFLEIQGAKIPDKTGDILSICSPSAKHLRPAGPWLGPALAYRILSLFGGSVSVENLDLPESG